MCFLVAFFPNAKKKDVGQVCSRDRKEGNTSFSPATSSSCCAWSPHRQSSVMPVPIPKGKTPMDLPPRAPPTSSGSSQWRPLTSQPRHAECGRSLILSVIAQSLWPQVKAGYEDGRVNLELCSMAVPCMLRQSDTVITAEEPSRQPVSQLPLSTENIWKLSICQITLFRLLHKTCVILILISIVFCALY